MAAIVNVQRAFLNQNLFRRRRIFAPAALVATSAAKLVDVPGLRQPARAMREIFADLKPDIFQTPKDISVRAQEQIDRIDGTMDSIASDAKQIGSAAQGETDIRAKYLIGAQDVVDKLEGLKAKLVRMKDKRYNQKLLYQDGMIRNLDEYDRTFQEAKEEYLVLGTSQFIRVASEDSKFEVGKVPSSPAGVVQLKNHFKYQGQGLVASSEPSKSPYAGLFPLVCLIMTRTSSSV